MLLCKAIHKMMRFAPVVINNQLAKEFTRCLPDK